MTDPTLPCRNIVVLSDGTGNSSAKAEKTNVWRMFQALDQSRTAQIAKYDDGVGTSSNRYLAGLGGAFGWGLKRNVLDLYKFICRNYVDGDRIYGFGFSRGAFTIRVLVGLIAREGLVAFRTEEELDRHAAAAYRAYRSKSFHRWSPLVLISRGLRDLFLWTRDRIKGRPTYKEISASSQPVRIHFLGLWDTVEAYGMPVTELKRAIDRYVWPMLFGDCKLSMIVQRACHALSLDDERTTFHPLLWDEVDEATRVATASSTAGASRKDASTSRGGRITQVWFAGVHSNVGGGYPEDQLSLVALRWMMAEASAENLMLHPEAVRLVDAEQSPYARLYDSRKGLASYYRYSPRKIDILEYKNGKETKKIWPIVHGSVVMRMAYGSDGYAPISLPHQFWVLEPSGALIPLAGPAGLESDAAKRQSTAPVSSDSQLAQAIAHLAKPDWAAIRLVWDTVFWRRCVYSLTVALTIWLVVFPWVPHLEAGRFDDAVRGPASTVVDALSNFIPSYAQSWKDAVLKFPLEFSGFAFLVLFCLGGSSILEQRIHDRSRLAWHDAVATNYRSWRKESRSGWLRWLVTALVVLLAALGIAYVSGARTETLWTLVAAITAVLLMLVFRALGYREIAAKATTTGKIRSTLALSIARELRKNPLLQFGTRIFTKHLVPIAFLVALTISALILVNRTAFDIEDSAGAYCTGTPDLKIPGEKVGAATSNFENNRMCWPSGLVLSAGQRYLITVSTPGDWFDKTLRTDPTGFEADGLIHYSASPLKRRWREPWMAPIARIGAFGNEEYPLEPIDDVMQWPAAPCGTGAEARDTSAAISAKIDPALKTHLMECNPTPKDRLVLRSVITARSDGELFLYVNDAVWGIPRWADTFVANNSGTATVNVRRLPKSPLADEIGD